MHAADLSDLLRTRPGGSGALGAIPFRNPLMDDPLHAGADNLVDKAINRLHEGEAERARSAVAHAARLGWCEDEEVPYGVFASHLAMFDEIVTSLESEEPTQMAWRDASLEVLQQADELESRVLLDVLAAILGDYDFPKREVGALRKLVGDRKTPDDFGLDASSSTEAVQAVIWAMVSVTSEVHRRLYH